jgi:hypothetical protein
MSAVRIILLRRLVITWDTVEGAYCHSPQTNGTSRPRASTQVSLIEKLLSKLSSGNVVYVFSRLTRVKKYGLLRRSL